MEGRVQSPGSPEHFWAVGRGSRKEARYKFQKKPKPPQPYEKHWGEKTSWRHHCLRNPTATLTLHTSTALGAASTSASSCLTPGSQNSTRQRCRSLPQALSGPCLCPEPCRASPYRFTAAAVYLHSHYEPARAGGTEHPWGSRSRAWGQQDRNQTPPATARAPRQRFQSTGTSWGTLRIVHQLLTAGTERDLLQAVIFCRARAEGRDDLGNAN